MTSEEQTGQVITFYSYKGGTGRSMALANVACLLARGGYKDIAGNPALKARVLAVDWDLEAPGLHRFFEPLLSNADFERYLAEAPGLIDLFLALKDGFEDGSQRFLDRVTAFATFDSIDIDQYLTGTSIPNLDLMKAGRMDGDYPARVADFPWEALFNRAPGLFPALAEYLTSRYDFVLIDSRTGLTDTSGICTLHMPEKLVLVFTLNRQSLTGIEALVPKAIRYRLDSNDWRPLTIFPLPSRVEPARSVLLSNWRNGHESSHLTGYQVVFETLLKQYYDLSKCDLTEYFDEVQLQYIPDYAFGERIAVEEEPGDSRLALKRSYIEFAHRLVHLGGPWEDLTSIRAGYELQRLIDRVNADLQDDNLLDARRHAQQALSIHKGHQDLYAPRLAKVAEAVAIRMHKREELAEAEVLLRSALEVISRSLGEDNIQYVWSSIRLAELLLDQHRINETKKIYQKASILYQKVPKAAGAEELESLDARLKQVSLDVEERDRASWQEQQVIKAIKQLYSSDKNAILAACQTLAAQEHPSRLEARPQLLILAQNTDKRIREQAEIALRAIGSKVFISYAHADRQWFERMRVHLKPIEREGMFEIWDDTRIAPGIPWRDAIRTVIESTQVAVLLVSADYLASDFVTSEELPRLLRAAEKHHATILPVIIRPCLYTKTELGHFQSVNPPNRPLARMTEVEQDEFFVKLSEKIAEGLYQGALWKNPRK